jgi:succinoglycan biosynthesis protein ExoA
MPENHTPDVRTLPLVSVIVPCRNEVAFIGSCLDSIAASSYPRDRLEVLVVDGASTDGTREIIEQRALEFPFVRRIHNEKRITPVALNLGIRASRGAYVVWMSAHNAYPPDYIPLSVEWAERSGADNVGGVIDTRPRSEGLWARGVVAAHTHAFGVGASRFRIHRGEPQFTDTVFGGCYRRDVFDRVGLFNERLTRGQDMEFNLRLKRAGGKTLLVPAIQSIYHARTRPWEFARYTWVNGEWAILPFLYSEGAPVGMRHLVPLGFAGALTAGVAALAAGFGWTLFLLVATPYVVANALASIDVAIRRRRPSYLPVMPWVFALFHLSYGFGSISGVLKLLGRWLREGRTTRDR